MTFSTRHTTAACFAMAAFAVAILSGLAGDIPSAQVLTRSVVAMFVCYLIGWLIGLVFERVIVAHLHAHLVHDQPVAVGPGKATVSDAPSDREEAIVV